MFAIVFVGSGYFAYNGVLYFNIGKTTLGYIIGIGYLALWIFFLIGVSAYLMFFTRNTFRMYYDKDYIREHIDDTDTEDNEDTEDTEVLVEGELP